MDFGFLDESSGAGQYDFAPAKSAPAAAAAATTTSKEEKRKEEGAGSSSAAGECACRYCGASDPACLVMCSECRRWFCNGRGGMSAAHIVQHLVRAKHKEIALHKDGPAGGAPIECYNCGSRNVFTLGYVPATSTSVVVLLCREPCAALGHDRCVRNPDWDLSRWAPLISERSLVPWLAAVPAPAPSSDGSGSSAAHAFCPRLGDILRLEAAWRLGHPHATYRDLPALPTVEEMEQEARFAAAAAAAAAQQQQSQSQGQQSQSQGWDDAVAVNPDSTDLYLRPVLLRYEAAEQYSSEVFKPLVLAEAAAERALKESQTCDGITVRWDASEGDHLLALFYMPRYDRDVRVVSGDELLLRRGTWHAHGHVVRIQNEEVVLKLARHSGAPVDERHGYAVELVFRPVTYQRMCRALDRFVHSEGCMSSDLYHLILGHEDAVHNDNLSTPSTGTASEGHRGKKKKTATKTAAAGSDDKDNKDDKDDKDDDEEEEEEDAALIVQAPGLPELNESQALAVRSTAGRALSLIQGPPGTGKTVTSATVVYAMARAHKGDKVLVCAPSNVAVDQIAEKIYKTGLKVLRVCSRTRETVATPVLFLTLHEQLRALHVPELERYQARKDSGERVSDAEHAEYTRVKRRWERHLVSHADVVCCTCAGAGDARLAGTTFARVLVDESTQAQEPECLIPLVAGARQVVLVGDHCQLGPVVLCQKAARAGLCQSLFERLLLLGVRPTRLQVQYRMHPGLSEFPSNFFYEGTLQNGVTARDRAPPANFSFPWYRPARPMMFYNCAGGQEEISASGTSYLNRAEAAMCEKFVTALLRAGVRPAQIGVITPYEGQRAYIYSTLLRTGPLLQASYLDVEVASVDSFQGREKDYIIMSCVRSSEHQGIGFLRDPRRLNVAITRCRYGLVILGNARLLARYPLWNALLAHYRAADCLVEGPLASLTPCLLQFCPPEKLHNTAATMCLPSADSSSTTTSSSTTSSSNTAETKSAARPPQERTLSSLVPAAFQSGSYNAADAAAHFVPAPSSSSTASSSSAAPSLLGVTPESSYLSFQSLAMGMTDMSLGLSQCGGSQQYPAP